MGEDEMIVYTSSYLADKELADLKIGDAEVLSAVYPLVYWSGVDKEWRGVALEDFRDG